MDLSHHEINGGHRIQRSGDPSASTRSSTLSSSVSTGVIIGGAPNSLLSGRNRLSYSARASTSSGANAGGEQIRNLCTTLFTMRIETVDFRLKTEAGGPLEPYYLSLALYDVKNGKKISEDFHATLDIDGNLEGNTGVSNE